MSYSSRIMIYDFIMEPDKKNVLYITYDSLTSPLGQSQVLSYIYKLNQRGVDFTILSFENEEFCTAEKEIELSDRLHKEGISWIKLSYHKEPPLFSTLFDIWKGYQRGKRIVNNTPITIIHTRSYVPQLIGALLKGKCKAKLVFDIRGFWFDERVEGGLWKKDGLLFKVGKKIEKYLYKKADAVIVLTHNAKKTLLEYSFLKKQSKDIHVIPTCVDGEIFQKARKSEAMETKYRLDFLSEKDFVLLYLGSLGTWYLLDEMLDFYSCLKKNFKNPAFLFVTHSDHNLLREKLREKNILNAHIISADSKDIPSILKFTDASILFYKPLFSKKATCPTKLGESLAAGLPVIINSGIGDTESLVEEHNVGVVVREFSLEHFEEKSKTFLNTFLSDETKKRCENLAREEFNIESAVNTYLEVYGGELKR
ncbi:MAG: glycosyltransferase family 4 protein [Nitrospinae bacterium]|nr:glycosyltransferase family 4 protein [Nitrospinota bacterium]